MSANSSRARHEKVLVLDPQAAPSVVSLGRAITLVYLNGEAILLEANGSIHASKVFDRPTVIMLGRLAKQFAPRVSLSRKNILIRDNHQCQYCGATGVELNLDHVMPKSRGGKRSWRNIVSSCYDCNTKKADRTPEEAGMTLLKEPREPEAPVMFQLLTQAGSEVREVWKRYLEQFGATPGDGTDAPTDETAAREGE